MKKYIQSFILKLKEFSVKRLYKIGFTLRPIARNLVPNRLKSTFRSMEKKVIRKAYTYTVTNNSSFNQESDHSISNHRILELGVNLIGYIRANTGIGEASRSTARALMASNLPFGIIDFQVGNVTQMNDNSWKHKENTDFRYNTNIFHINADQILLARTHIKSSDWNSRYNIGHWVWELAEFPDEWCEGFKVLDEVWVPSKFVEDAVSKKANVPVTRIPYCIQAEYDVRTKREYFKLPENTFLFLSMYDVYSIQERKNPYAAINAFKSTFKPDDKGVGLVIKINNIKGAKKEAERLRENVCEYKNIYILDQMLNKNEVYALIHLTDTFISLHRSEGFGLVLAEAMYLGRPVIGTNWSGNTDFMNKDNSCAVDYSLIKLGKDFGPYKANQHWADPDLENASYYMKKLVQDTTFYKEIAFKGQHTIFNEHSPYIIGRLIEQRLRLLSKYI